MTRRSINWFTYASPRRLDRLAGRLIPWFAVAAAVLFATLVIAVPAAAQESAAAGPSLDAAALQVPAQVTPLARDATPASSQRPSPLVPLYVSFGALQVLDAQSTSQALARGGVEANPLVKGFAGNDAAMLAVKAAGTAGVIYASEKMWKRNRKAAVIFMVAANAGMAWVVQHNYRANR